MKIGLISALFFLELPHRREIARASSCEKLLEERTNNGGNLKLGHRRYRSDTAATFTGMFRKGVQYSM